MGILKSILRPDNEPTKQIVPTGTDQVTEEPEKVVSANTGVLDGNQSEENPPVEKYPHKPSGLKDDYYEHLLNFYTPEGISMYYQPYEPDKDGGFMERIFMASKHKPELDQRKQDRSFMLGSIGDSLRLIGEMVAAGMGARISPRDPASSALSRIMKKSEEEENRYLRQLELYNDGLTNARMKDFISGLEAYRNGQKDIRSLLLNKYAKDQAKELAQLKIDQNDQKMIWDQFNKDRDFEWKAANQKNTEKHRQVMEAQGWARLADRQNRTTAYLKKGTGKAKDSYEMVIEAHPNDPDKETDYFGSHIRVFEMTKGEIDRYARAALSDEAFMARHPELIIQDRDLLGRGTTRYRPDADVAAAYMKEMYLSQFTGSQTSTYTPSTPPVLPDTTLTPYQPTQKESEPEPEVDEWEEYLF